MRVRLFFARWSHRVRGSEAANKIQSVFCGGVYAAKTTLRAAKCRRPASGWTRRAVQRNPFGLKKDPMPCRAWDPFLIFYSAFSAAAFSAAALAAAAFFSAAAFCAALNFSFSSGVGIGSMALRGQALAHMVQFLHLL